jgi:BirA family transcriptional regulator, biotin operon repressor / biotin---[acetyl-CoA-carboxylase] ligase
VPATAFDVPAFLARLRAQGSGLGEPFSFHQQATSTNDLAKDAARAGAPHGATFLADEQSSGRGRRGRQWLAAPGEALLFSFVLRPPLDPARLSMLTLCVGLGVRAGLAQFARDALTIKWPNDILSGERKLAGILVEAESSNDKPPCVIVGVGINVLGQAFPSEIAQRATSLVQLGAQGTREEVLVAVLVQIDHWCKLLFAGKTSPIVEALREHDALWGRAITVDGVRGIARGIDPSGCLLLEVDGRQSAVRSGTVEWDAATPPPLQ